MTCAQAQFRRVKGYQQLGDLAHKLEAATGHEHDMLGGRHTPMAS